MENPNVKTWAIMTQAAMAEGATTIETARAEALWNGVEYVQADGSGGTEQSV